jgi:hypothetical protein
MRRLSSAASMMHVANGVLAVRRRRGHVDEFLDQGDPLRILLEAGRRRDHADVHARRILARRNGPEQEQTILRVLGALVVPE